MGTEALKSHDWTEEEKGQGEKEKQNMDILCKQECAKSLAKTRLQIADSTNLLHLKGTILFLSFILIRVH